MRTYGYTRVSTSDQSTTNQRLELEQAGYDVDEWFEEVGVSGKVPAAQRPRFAELLVRLNGPVIDRKTGTVKKGGDTLVVSKLDRLGRDAIDVQQTVRGFAGRGIRVLVHSLGGTDLTSPSGKLMMTMLAAVAEMERDLLVERTHAGLVRARAQGKVLGRRPSLNSSQRGIAIERASAGVPIAQVARDLGVSRGTIYAALRASQTPT
jgi:putative DNA-invertase from lambdoid prophage Rac